jgi:hypothetical protein
VMALVFGRFVTGSSFLDLFVGSFVTGRLVAGCFVPGRIALGYSFLDSCFRRLVSGSSFLDPRFWFLFFLVPRFFIFIPGIVGRYAADSCLYWLRSMRLGA